MTDIEPFDAAEVREQHWPLLVRDPDLTTSAGETVYEIVRYLNHSSPSSVATPWAGTLYLLTGGVAGAVHGLNQLSQQLANRAADMCSDPTVRHSERRGDGARVARDAAITELMAAAALFTESAALAKQLGDRLDAARSHVTWIAHDD